MRSNVARLLSSTTHVDRARSSRAKLFRVSLPPRRTIRMSLYATTALYPHRGLSLRVTDDLGRAGVLDLDGNWELKNADSSAEGYDASWKGAVTNLQHLPVARPSD
jgi:hypothetical protein